MKGSFRTGVCFYDGSRLEVVTGEEIYPAYRNLHHRLFHRCVKCGSYVGTHVKTGKPLGDVANAELRKLRMRVHAAFDPLWKQGFIARNEAYELLAKEMKIKRVDCHIGHFREQECQKALEILNNKFLEKSK